MRYRRRFFGGPLDGVWSEADVEGEPPELVAVDANGRQIGTYELTIVLDRPDGGAIALYRESTPS